MQVYAFWYNKCIERTTMNSLETIVKFIENSHIKPGQDSINNATNLVQTGDINFLPMIIALIILAISIICIVAYKKNYLKQISNSSIINGYIKLSRKFNILFVLTSLIVLTFAITLFFILNFNTAFAQNKNISEPHAPDKIIANINPNTLGHFDKQNQLLSLDKNSIDNQMKSFKLELTEIDIEKLDPSINCDWQIYSDDSQIYNGKEGKQVLKKPKLIEAQQKFTFYIKSNINTEEVNNFIDKDIIKINFKVNKILDSNLLKIAGKDAFNDGEMQNLKIDTLNNVESLTLEDNKTQGNFISSIYNIDEFTDLVCSWSASIPEGSSLEVFARAYVEKTEINSLKWTEWLTWGEFSPYIRRGTKEGKKCDDSYIDQDTFRLKNCTPHAIQVKVNIKRENIEAQSLKLRQVSVTTKGANTKIKYAEDKIDIPSKSLIRASACSQSIRDPKMGGSICSPTTAENMLFSRISDCLIYPEISALGTKDYGENIFGNWTFTTSYLACFGFETYCQYANKDILLQELAKGQTLGLHVRYKSINSTKTDLPLLHGAYGDTRGHLIALIGYEYENGIIDDDHLYFYSADSYDSEDKYCYRKYKWTELEQCWWTNMAYICPQTTPDVYNEKAYTMKNVELVNVIDNKYELWSDGKKLDLNEFKDQNGSISTFVIGVGTDMTKDPEDTWHSIKYAKPMNAFSNNKFTYYEPDNEGLITFEPYGDKPIQFCAIDSRAHLYHTVIQPQQKK